jgi:integrase
LDKQDELVQANETNKPLIAKSRKFFPKAHSSGRVGKQEAILFPAIDSIARIGESVARRRFQRGSVNQNTTKTVWIGNYSEYVLDAHGVEKRIRHQVVLCAVKDGGKAIGKREAQRLLQPYVDRVNSSIGSQARERKSATFEGFAAIWEREYLSLSKPSTQSSTRSQLKRLKAAFGRKDMRHIDAGDIQRLIAATKAEGLDPKTARNLWGTVSLIWQAALTQKYVDAVLPKPKLPRRIKKKARCFLLSDVATIIANSQGEGRTFFWLAAETALRSGELAGLKVNAIDGESLTVEQTVWGGGDQSPKTESSIRTLALSPQLVSLLWEQIARQKAKGHEYLFTTSKGTPWDMDTNRSRKLHPFLKSLDISSAGYHAFRHFNSSLMDALRVPVKTIQERLGHALTGVFTLDVYGGKPDWERNIEAAQLLGAEIERAVMLAELKREQESQGANADYSGGLTSVLPSTMENGSGATTS